MVIGRTPLTLGDPIDIARLVVVPDRGSSDDVRCWNGFCGEDCLDRFDRPRFRPRRDLLGAAAGVSCKDRFAVACSSESSGLMTEVTGVPPWPSLCRIVTAFVVGGDDLGTMGGLAGRGCKSGEG